MNSQHGDQEHPQDKLETWLHGQTVFSEGEMSNDSQILQLEDSQIFQLDGTTRMTQELDSTPTTPLPGKDAEKHLGFEGVGDREELAGVEVRREVFEMSADPIVPRIDPVVSRNASNVSSVPSRNQTLSPAWNCSDISRNSSMSMDISPASERGGSQFGSPSPHMTPIISPLTDPFADGEGREMSYLGPTRSRSPPRP